MEIIQKIGMVLATIGVFGAIVVADFIAGVSKAQRMGKQNYPKEQRKKKWKWVLIFCAIGILGAVLYWLGGSTFPVL